jgi:hypothetical protein
MLAMGIEPQLLRACLLDRVGMEHRLIGWVNVERSEHAPLTGQMAAVVRRLGLRLGRRLWDDEAQGPFIRSGNVVTNPPLEAAAVGIGAATRLPVWLVGLTQQGSVAALESALSATETDVMGRTALTTTLRPEQLAADLGLARPHTLILAGGFERAEASVREQMLHLAATVARACAQMPEKHRPAVVYAGAGQLAATVKALFTELVGDEALVAIPNVHPEPGVIERAELVRMLSDHQWRRVRQQPGIGRVGQWVTPPLQLTRLETTFAQLLQAWRDYHDLPVLHGAYISDDRHVHVWCVSTRPDIGLLYHPATPTLEPIPGWPPLRLISGAPQALPDGITWWDQSGLAPLIGTFGHVAPEAMLQVLTHDVFRRMV